MEAERGIFPSLDPYIDVNQPFDLHLFFCAIDCTGEESEPSFDE